MKGDAPPRGAARGPAARWRVRIGTCSALVLAAACGGAESDAPPDAPVTEAGEAGGVTVYAVNYPLAFMAERIGGPGVTVVLPAPPGVDPATWNPGPEVVAAYQEADLILLNGAGYAAWTARAALPESRVVNTTAGLEDRYVTEPGAVTHSHGPEGEHTHDEIAYTTWLDPTLAVEQARGVAAALGERWPERAAGFEARLTELEAEILSVDAEQEAAVGQRASTPVLGSHPVYQYLADRYGLNLRAVHFEPGEAPDEDAWHGLEHLLEDHPARWMLWEAEPLPETRARLEGLGVRSVVYDPAGNRPARGDFLTVMRANVEALRTVYGT